MPNGDKIVQLPSGERVQFPASMADADVNSAIEQYLGQKQQTDFAARRAKGIGVSPSLGKPSLWERTGIPEVGESLTGAADWLRGGVSDIQSRELAKVAAGGARSPIATGAKVATGGAMADVADVLGRMLASPKQTGLAAAQAFPLTRIPANLIMAGESAGDIGNVVRAEHPLSPENIQRALFDLAGVTGGAGGAMHGVRGTVGALRTTGREVMGEGSSKARLLSDQHEHAMATQQHLGTVADAVHADAQGAMSGVLAKVDAAKPEGFVKADIQSKVKGAVGDLVKVPEKMPSSIGKILKVEKEVGGPSVGGRQLNLKDPGDLAAYQRMKASGAFTPEEVQRWEGGGDSLTAEQLKQMRSDVGMELGRYGSKGVVGGALKKVYGVLSDELRGAAKDAGVEPDWLQANDKYSQYAKDFVNKGAPLRLSLLNKNASGIMEPLTGANRQVILDTLQKYKDAGFDVDMDTIQEEMRRYGMAKTITRLSNPTKMDLLMAGFAPKALAIRQLGPRLMRNPKALDLVAGEGFETVPTKRVYPTKAAAMKARKP